MSLSLFLYLGFGLFVLILLVWGAVSFRSQNVFGARELVASARSRTTGRLSQANELSDTQKRLLTFCLLPSHLRHETLLSLKVGTLSAEEIKSQLNREFGLDSRDAILAQLDYLLSGMRSTTLDNDLINSTVRAQDARKAVAAALILSPQCINAIDSTYAWDLGEAAELSKLAHAAGYLTKVELWNYLEQISDGAQRFGRDWYEYTLSYLLGRVLDGNSIEDVTNQIYEIFHLPGDVAKRIPGINAYTRFRFTINKDGTGMNIRSAEHPQHC